MIGSNTRPRREHYPTTSAPGTGTGSNIAPGFDVVVVITCGTGAPPPVRQ